MKFEKIEVYKSDGMLDGGLWRWRRIARNGKIVGASSEAYVRRADALRNARRQFERCAVVILAASLLFGCACEKAPDAPTVCDRQLELCKLDLMVCRGAK